MLLRHRTVRILVDDHVRAGIGLAQAHFHRVGDAMGEAQRRLVLQFHVQLDDVTMITAMTRPMITSTCWMPRCANSSDTMTAAFISRSDL